MQTAMYIKAASLVNRTCKFHFLQNISTAT